MLPPLSSPLLPAPFLLPRGTLPTHCTHILNTPRVFSSRISETRASSHPTGKYGVNIGIEPKNRVSSAGTVMGEQLKWGNNAWNWLFQTSVYNPIPNSSFFIPENFHCFSVVLWIFSSTCCLVHQVFLMPLLVQQMLLYSNSCSKEKLDGAWKE